MILPQVTIGLAALPTERYKRNVIRGKLDLVVSCGGTAGLFVGASLLSFVEIFYYFIVRPCYHKHTTTKAPPKKVENILFPFSNWVFRSNRQRFGAGVNPRIEQTHGLARYDCVDLYLSFSSYYTMYTHPRWSVFPIWMNHVVWHISMNFWRMLCDAMEKQKGTNTDTATTFIRCMYVYLDFQLFRRAFSCFRSAKR